MLNKVEFLQTVYEPHPIIIINITVASPSYKPTNQRKPIKLLITLHNNITRFSSRVAKNAVVVRFQEFIMLSSARKFTLHSSLTYYAYTSLPVPVVVESACACLPLPSQPALFVDTSIVHIISYSTVDLCQSGYVTRSVRKQQWLATWEFEK